MSSNTCIPTDAIKRELPRGSAGDGVSPKLKNGLWAEWYAGTYKRPNMARITNPIANRRTKDALPLTLPLLLTVIAGKSMGSSRDLSIYMEKEWTLILIF